MDIDKKNKIIEMIGSDIFKWGEMIKDNAKNKLDDPKWTKFVDKVLFKEYCAKKNVPTFKTLALYDQKDWEKITDDFHKFPNKFILKSNKGYNRNCIIKNKRWKKNALNGLSKRFNRRCDWGKPHLAEKFIHLEPQYEYTEPKIIIEELILPIPEDIKIFFLDKKPVLIQIDTDRYSGHKRNLFNLKAESIPLRFNYDLTDKRTILDDVIENDQLIEMIDTAKRLAEDVDLDLFRVDIYYIDKVFYGGEITLSPEAGKFKLSIL